MGNPVYSMLELLRDIANQAQANRAGEWLLIAADDYPWLFSAITENLHAPPEAVYNAACQRNVLIGIMLGSQPRELVYAFIQKLQAFFIEKGY
jgi:hypothetical protein